MANEEGREQAIPHLQHALMDVGSGINPLSGIKFVHVCSEMGWKSPMV